MKRRSVLLLLLGLTGGALALVFNASKAGTEVQGCPVGCAATASGNGEVVRILSLNVLHGFRKPENRVRRLDLMAEKMRRLQADIVALQEVPWSLRLGNGAAYLARRLGFNHAYLRANGNRRAILFEEGVAILSRFPLINLELRELEPRATFFEHRVALKATAITPQGDLDVFVTHLTHGHPQTNAGQARSLRAFVEEVRTNPAVIAGDFNAQVESAQIRALAETWQDAYRDAHPQGQGFTSGVTDLAGGPASEPLQSRIDYIFLAAEKREALRLRDARVVFDEPFWIGDGWLWASDHAGVLVTLEVAHFSATR